ncbi:hypothetical protein SAMN04488579_1241, partial [Eubacterium barkeri]
RLVSFIYAVSRNFSSGAFERIRTADPILTMDCIMAI